MSPTTANGAAWIFVTTFTTGWAAILTRPHRPKRSTQRCVRSVSFRSGSSPPLRAGVCSAPAATSMCIAGPSAGRADHSLAGLDAGAGDHARPLGDVGLDDRPEFARRGAHGV